MIKPTFKIYVSMIFSLRNYPKVFFFKQTTISRDEVGLGRDEVDFVTSKMTASRGESSTIYLSSWDKLRFSNTEYKRNLCEYECIFRNISCKSREDVPKMHFLTQEIERWCGGGTLRFRKLSLNIHFTSRKTFAVQCEYRKYCLTNRLAQQYWQYVKFQTSWRHSKHIGFLGTALRDEVVHLVHLKKKTLNYPIDHIKHREIHIVSGNSQNPWKKSVHVRSHGSHGCSPILFGTEGLHKIVSVQFFVFLKIFIFSWFFFTIIRAVISKNHWFLMNFDDFWRHPGEFGDKKSWKNKNFQK